MLSDKGSLREGMGMWLGNVAFVAALGANVFQVCACVYVPHFSIRKQIWHILDNRERCLCKGYLKVCYSKQHLLYPENEYAVCIICSKNLLLQTCFLSFVRCKKYWMTESNDRLFRHKTHKNMYTCIALGIKHLRRIPYRPFYVAFMVLCVIFEDSGKLLGLGVLKIRWNRWNGCR